jgi:hypothetical protein
MDEIRVEIKVLQKEIERLRAIAEDANTKATLADKLSNRLIEMVHELLIAVKGIQASPPQEEIMAPTPEEIEGVGQESPKIYKRVWGARDTIAPQSQAAMEDEAQAFDDSMSPEERRKIASWDLAMEK